MIDEKEVLKILKRYEGRMNPTAYFSLEADIVNIEEYAEPTTKNDLALIHTEGLDEEIRCTMCTNSIKSDMGCDGSCVVNNTMYKNVMDAIEKRIQPSVTPQEPFINKPCVSSGVCEHAKNKVLDKIRAEIIAKDKNVKAVRSDGCCFFTAEEVFEIIDKYKAETEAENGNDDN